MKKGRKILKILFVTAIITSCIILIASITFFTITTKGLALDEEKLQILDPTQTSSVYDSENNPIKPNSVSYIKLSKLSSQTQNAFICAEDKRFYHHHGIDIIRIGGAILSNIKSGSFSEGASTISQQLVKNTQLSNEKTISRKLKEIKLTQELEKKYTKDEILELYLNKIYFGNGCYGIENASKHYFNKSASELSLSESAILAGSINAPSVYDIKKNPEQAKQRRDLILKLMFNYNKITEKDYNNALNEEIKLDISDISGNSSLYKNIISEACEILDISEFNLQNSNYKIYTSINKNINDKFSNITKNYNGDFETCNIIIDNKTHSLISINGKSKILDSSWQPGSLIKPILVYAPALEKEIITPSTKILDEEINISGYKPENADKTYHGFVTAKTALANSYNVPAVKLLNETGINYSKEFASKLGIKFENSDNHLALALGGFEKGVSPLQLCEAYSAFANNGRYQQSSYITKITKNGKLIYQSKNNEKQVMQESTAKQINEMLLECSKTGTAKRLNNLPFNVCSKTGTVGLSQKKQNQLAYCICYTPNHTILTLIQGSSLPSNINGSSYPTMINKEILLQLYKEEQPDNFNQEKKTVLNKSTTLAKKSKTENKNTQSNENAIQIDNPQNKPSDFILTAINSPNHKPILCFTMNKNYDIYLIRGQKNKEEIIFSSLQNNEKNVKFIDKSAKNNKIYTYKLKFCDKLNNDEFFSNEIKLKTY